MPLLDLRLRLLITLCMKRDMQIFNYTGLTTSSKIYMITMNHVVCIIEINTICSALFVEQLTSP